MKKEIVKFSIMIILIIIPTTVFAFSEDIAKPTARVPDEIGSMVMEVLGIIQWVGYAIAIGMTIYVGIKYVMSAANEKAALKQAAINYLIGIVIIAGVTGVLTFSVKLLGGETGVDSEWIYGEEDGNEMAAAGNEIKEDEKEEANGDGKNEEEAKDGEKNEEEAKDGEKNEEEVKDDDKNKEEVKEGDKKEEVKDDDKKQETPKNEKPKQEKNSISDRKTVPTKNEKMAELVTDTHLKENGAVTYTVDYKNNGKVDKVNYLDKDGNVIATDTYKYRLGGDLKTVEYKETGSTFPNQSVEITNNVNGSTDIKIGNKDTYRITSDKDGNTALVGKIEENKIIQMESYIN